MARIRAFKNNFTGGELSPRLLGRVGFEKYTTGVEILINWIIYPHGGITRRPGTRFVEPAIAAGGSRLIPFQFSDQDAYILEIGHQAIRFYKGGVRIHETAKTITNAADNGSGAIRITATSHGYSTGTPVKVSGVEGTIEANGDWIVTNIDADNFDLNSSTFTNTYTSGGEAEKIVQVTTPYQESEIFDIQYAQSADVMWLVHPSYKPQKLSRTSDTVWTLVNYAPTSDPFTSANNYPRAVAFWSSRIWFGGTNNEPDTRWASQIGDFEDMSLGTGLDDEAIKIASSSGRVDVVRWFAPTNEALFDGTLGGESLIRGGLDKTVTPNNVNIRPDTAFGVHTRTPVLVSNNVVFIQRSGRKLRQASYNVDAESFAGPDLSLLSEHLAKVGLVQISYQAEPESTIWGVLKDGRLVSVAYLPEQKVFGWAQHTTSGTFLSVATIPHPNLDRDQTWVVVQRNINGSNVNYVEYFEDGAGFYNQLMLDSALPGSFGTPQSTVKGLHHLESETVRIVGDGAVQPLRTVTDGQVTVDPAAKKIEVGLEFLPKVVTLRPDEETATGQIQGRPVKRAKFTINLLNTVGMTVNGKAVVFRKGDDPMDAPPPLFSGDKEIITRGWGKSAGQITIEQPLPLPITIIYIIGDVEVGDND